jgi:ATP-dependent DNA ligase
MEALSTETLPQGKEWQYEPKWDGFRCLAFREGNNITLQSKSGQSLGRYFPELEEALSELRARQFILDGEIAVPTGGDFSFDALLQRIHPAVSRVRRLSTETPAIFVVFDLLAAQDGKSLLSVPLSERRRRLERFAGEVFPKGGSVRISPTTRSLPTARKWLAHTTTTLDGVIAKRLDLGYCSGERDAMQKVKNFRSADCVVGGFRYGKGKKLVGSLLLGLYDTNGLLHHVGFTSSIATDERPAITKKLEKLISPPGFTGSAPGGPSRWNRGQESAWLPLKPVLVAEVRYDHVTGRRFRHGTKLLRWRPDKAPAQCTMDQLKVGRSKIMRLLS